MTDAEMDTLLSGIVPAVKIHILELHAGLLARIAALEARAPVVGPTGERGMPGDAGPMGVMGPAGPMGPMGQMGPMGPHGDTGPAGATGERGADGRDGKDGQDGRDGQDGATGPTGDKGADGLHGKDGQDGRDGLGFDDLEGVSDAAGRLSLRFIKGDVVKTVAVPSVVYRGLYAADQAYQKGDTVTFGGSIWMATAETQGIQPNTTPGAACWRLAVKHGRDGKDGAPGAKGDEGREGRPGKDLTQVDLQTGRKW